MAATSLPPSTASSRMTMVQWLICIIAAIGFMFDTYELLMIPLAGPPAIERLLGVNRLDSHGFGVVSYWMAVIIWSSAICGGVFGLWGGYLTDRLGRRRVLTWSILLYAVSSAASAFSTNIWMLLALRCTTFIGVCVEFVAAVAWLSELFPEPKRREAVLGFTQAFGSVGGLLVTYVHLWNAGMVGSIPGWADIYGEHAAWRYTLLSGLIPALPLILIRPFLPESPAWREKRARGVLKRPSFSAIFAPQYLRTTIVTTVLFACGFGAAFGAIQVTPEIVPGLLPGSAEIVKVRKTMDAAKPGSDEYKAIAKKLGPLVKEQQQTVSGVQSWQEWGGLAGRFVIAILALMIARRGRLLRMFLIPGLLLIPPVYYFAAAGNLGANSLETLRYGMFVAGFFTVAQFSFWGNYLPRVYPVHLRGTGEGFAANVGGRMFGTAGRALAYGLSVLLPSMMPSLATASRPTVMAYAAGTVALLVYAVGLVVSFWLPEPAAEELPD